MAVISTVFVTLTPTLLSSMHTLFAVIDVIAVAVFFVIVVVSTYAYAALVAFDSAFDAVVVVVFVDDDDFGIVVVGVAPTDDVYSF